MTTEEIYQQGEKKFTELAKNCRTCKQLLKKMDNYNNVNDPKYEQLTERLVAVWNNSFEVYKWLDFNDIFSTE